MHFQIEFSNDMLILKAGQKKIDESLRGADMHMKPPIFTQQMSQWYQNFRLKNYRFMMYVKYSFFPLIYKSNFSGIIVRILSYEADMKELILEIHQQVNFTKNYKVVGAKREFF